MCKSYLERVHTLFSAHCDTQEHFLVTRHTSLMAAHLCHSKGIWKIVKSIWKIKKSCRKKLQFDSNHYANFISSLSTAKFNMLFSVYTCSVFKIFYIFIWLIKISFYWNGSNILLTRFGRGPFRWFSSFFEWIQTWQFKICSNQKPMKSNSINKMHYLIIKLSTAIFETLAETSSVHNQESLDFRDQEMYNWNA